MRLGDRRNGVAPTRLPNAACSPDGPQQAVLQAQPILRSPPLRGQRVNPPSARSPASLAMTEYRHPASSAASAAAAASTSRSS